jgi:hypothetical protein
LLPSPNLARKTFRSDAHCYLAPAIVPGPFSFLTQPLRRSCELFSAFIPARYGMRQTKYWTNNDSSLYRAESLFR